MSGVPRIIDQLPDMGGLLLRSQLADPRLPLERFPGPVQREDVLTFSGGDKAVIAFDDTALWNIASGTMALDTTNTRCRRLGKTGSIKLTADAVGASCYLNNEAAAFPALALQSGDVVVIRFYVHPGTLAAAPEGITKLRLYLYTAATPGGGDYIYREFWFPPGHLAASSIGGWYEVAELVDSFTTAGGGVTLGNLNGYRFHITKTGTDKTPSVTADRVLFYRPSHPKGSFVVRPDISTQAGSLAFAAALSELGVQMSVGVDAQRVGDSGYLTVADLRALAADGHDIVHYPGGPSGLWTSWASKTAAEKLAHVRYAALLWAENGLDPAGSRRLHMPGSDAFLPSDWDDLAGYVDVVASDRGYRAAETPYPLMPLWNPREIASSLVIDTVEPTWATVQTQAALAAATKSVFVLGGHCATSNQRTWQMQAVAYLLAAGLVPRTLGQLLRGELDDGAGQREASAFFAASNITGAEAETLTGAGDADSLHTHGGKLDAAALLRGRVSAQFDKNNATLANVPGLSVPLAAGKTYAFRAHLFLATSSGGAKVAMGGTATATAIGYDARIEEDTGDAVPWNVTGDHLTALGQSVEWGEVDLVAARIEGCITVNAAGTLTVQFAQQNASGTSSVLVGSHLIVHEIP